LKIEKLAFCQQCFLEGPHFKVVKSLSHPCKTRYRSACRKTKLQREGKVRGTVQHISTTIVN
jgi:hypothetical protein